MESGRFPELTETLARLPDLRLAILFGSLATGRHTPDSDLDLAVDLGTPMNTERKMQLIAELAAATGRPVDLIDLQTVGEPLLGRILQQGVRLHGSNTDYGRLLARHLFDEADFMPYYRRILRERRDRWIGN